MMGARSSRPRNEGDSGGHMFIFYSDKVYVREDIWAGEAFCPTCGARNRLYLATEVSDIKLLCFIPILRFIQKRLVVCDSCKTETQVSRADYKARLATQRARLLAGQFPAGELARERAKLAQTSTRRVVKLVASSILLLATLSLALAMIVGLDLPSDGEVPAVMALVASAVAFALSLKHLLYAERVKAAIERVLGRA